MNDELKRHVVEQLLESRKYRTVGLPTLERVADWAMARADSPKGIVKAAKRKLHQVYGAYMEPSALKRVEELVNGLRPGMASEEMREVCRQIMACHASTRERLPILEIALPALREAVGPFGSISDLACGLNPFCLPWLDPDAETQYFASDIDERLVAVINRFLEQMGRPPTAASHDILCGNPRMAEVVLLFKTLPILEQQEKGTGETLFRQFASEPSVRSVVISFPSKSLGGHGKGMGLHYEEFMESVAGPLGFAPQKVSYSTEVFYIFRTR